MASEEDSSALDEVSSAFLQELREAVSAGRRPGPKRIVEIASNGTARIRLVDLVRTHGVEPALRDALLDFIEETAEDFEAQAEQFDALVDLVDRAGLPVTIALALSGIGLLVNSGFALAPETLLVGGVASLTAASVGRTVVKLRANSKRAVTKKLRRLGARLKEL